MACLNFTHALPRLAPGAVLPGEDAERIREPLRRLVGARFASRILERTGAVGVTRMPADELAALADISRRAAERIVAARELGLAAVHRLPEALCSSADVLRALPPGFATLETEVVLAFALTAQHTVKATVLLSKGGDVGTAIKLRDIFVPLSRLSAAAFILAHNHPGGSPVPSSEDLDLTKRVVRASLVMGIDFLDHVIVASTGSVSLRDIGALI